MSPHIINDKTSLAIIPKVVVGGTVNRIANSTVKAPNKEMNSRNQNDLNISISSILFIQVSQAQLEGYKVIRL